MFQANYKVEQFFRFLLKRSIRIDPAYILAIFLTLGLFKAMSFVPSYRGIKLPFIPAQFLAHVFYFVPFTKYPFYLHVFWTLCVEFPFYLLVGLGYFLVDNRIYRSVFLLLFASSCFIPFSNAYYLIFNYAPVFALGISLVDYYKQHHWQNLILPFICLIIMEIKFGIPIFILILLSSAAILYFKSIIKPLGFLGNISYSLYLTHELVAIVVLGLAKKLNIEAKHNQILLLIAEVCFAILFAWVYYMTIEKPSINLSKKIFYKKGNDAKNSWWN